MEPGPEKNPGQKSNLSMTSIEDQFLHRLARGLLIEQDEYDQLCQDLPPEDLARAMAQRFSQTNEVQALIEAARLYSRAGLFYEALEVCSRSPRVPELQKIIQKLLPQVQRDYPETRLVGKLLDEALLVLDLTTGKIVRFPPIMPTTMTAESAENREQTP